MKQIRFQSVVGFFIAAILLLPVFQGEAAAWWNENWQYRVKITFNTSTHGADIQESQMDVPILIRLHSGNLNFANTKADGTDIRFVSADDQNLLKHHIERFDLIEEIALMWVKTPKIAANFHQDYIWMYYGNGDAMGGQDAKSTYDAGFAGVYHFGEIEGSPQDSSAAGNHATDFSGGLGLPAVIGTGLSLNGGGNRMMITDAPNLNFGNGFTISAWVRITMDQNDAVLFYRGTGETHFRIGVDGSRVYAAMRDKTKVWQTERTVDLSPETWHHVSVVASPGNRLTLFMDGLEMNFANLPKTLPVLVGDISVGAEANGGQAFFGELDELQISSMTRSPAWIRTAFASQGPDGLLYAMGAEEVGGGSKLPVFYLSTIMKNITLDGWAVIGLLVVLGALSWITFLTKTAFLWMTRRDNKAFLHVFNQAQSLKALKDDADNYPNSGLFRVFNIGLETLVGCLSNPEMCYVSQAQSGNPKPIKRKRLNVKGMNAFKTVLERGFIEETQRLNAWLVVLTLAISGGPFLGLLGTVWGVMNTFAAMAEAGEADIMAIAPGVASALSTTVIGLIVAIPALFSYNYLTGKIKDMTADLTIFIDQYAVRIDQLYGDTHETPAL